MPVGSPGALQVQQESGPFANSAIASAYDELGRLASRTVQGAGAETFQYDTIGRLSGHTSDLGAFTLGYLGQTGQIASRQLASSTLATSWTYLNNAGDRRLAGIANTGLTAGHFSNFTFTTTREDQVASIAETSDASAVYPSALTQTGTYNTLNQLTNLSGQALTWDSVGNLTDDGQRTYTWDAENRLVGIGYPAQPGKATAFAYDGLGRRVSIAETPPGGGTPVTTRYLWCGDALCQARDGSNVTTRSYYDEGEFVPGSPGQPYYYGIDQLGSVRRAFASTTSAPAFNYDPYGAPLSGPAPTTDFGFAGLFNHPASGLNLTLYRAYDPVAGRWLSRDPIGEPGDSYGNLYPYVANNTPNAIDPLGLVGVYGPGSGGAPSGDCQDARATPRDRGQPPCLLASLTGMPCGVGGGGGSSARGGGGSKVQPPVVRPGNPPKVETPDPTKGTRPGTEDRRLQDLHEHRRLTEKKPQDPHGSPPTTPKSTGEIIMDRLRGILGAWDKIKDSF